MHVTDNTCRSRAGGVCCVGGTNTARNTFGQRTSKFGRAVWRRNSPVPPFAGRTNDALASASVWNLLLVSPSVDQARAGGSSGLS